MFGVVPIAGKSTIAQQLASRINIPNVMQTDVIYEVRSQATAVHSCSSIDCIPHELLYTRCLARLILVQVALLTWVLHDFATAPLVGEVPAHSLYRWRHTSTMLVVACPAATTCRPRHSAGASAVVVSAGSG